MTIHNVSENPPAFVPSIQFVETSDPTTVSVSGLSTDRALVNAIGRSGNKPAKVKYFKFADGITAAIIKLKGSENEYTLRSPRSPSSAPPRMEDPIAAIKAAEDAVVKAREDGKTKIIGAIAEAQEAFRQVTEKHNARMAELQATLDRLNGHH